jgi:hypothetical protein
MCSAVLAECVQLTLLNGNGLCGIFVMQGQNAPAISLVLIIRPGRKNGKKENNSA